MNLTACNNCGVVLDKDSMMWPQDIWKEGEGGNYEADFTKATWNGKEYTPFLPCPVCDWKVLKDD